MKPLQFKNPFPLLAKELVEQANRKRTYALRAIFVAATGGFLLLEMRDAVSGEYDINLWDLALAADNIMILIIASLYILTFLILPASAATSITSERERGSLDLLLVTKLSPWKIVTQKFLGRVIPIAMFAFLCLPIAAVSYTLGGGARFSNEGFIYAVLGLLALVTAIAAWGVFFSSIFNDTLTATVATYAATLIATFALILLIDSAPSPSDLKLYLKVIFSVQLISALAALTAASLILKRRWTLGKGNLALRIFKRLDRYWKKLNDRYCAGIEILAGEAHPLPDNNPIEWFEKHKRATGSASHLLRLTTILMIPTSLLLLALLLDARPRSDTEEIALFLWCVYMVIASLTLLLKSVAIVNEERKNQTLDILLTTPISAEKLVKTRAKALQRLHFAMALPLLLLALIMAGTTISKQNSISRFLALATLAILHMKTIMWGSIWVGLHIRINRKALATAFVLLSIWLFAPLIIADILRKLSYVDYDGIFHIIDSISPIAVIVEISARNGIVKTIASLSAIPAIIAYLFFRFFSLRLANRLLRR